MTHHLTQAACLREFKVYLEFDDGAKGVIDLEDRAKRGGVFEPLNDPRYFRKLHLDPSLGTICWPNGADLAPDFLYEQLKTSPLHAG